MAVSIGRACLLLGTLLAPTSASADSPGPKAFVLDRDARSVKVLDVATGVLTATIDFEDEGDKRPEHIWASPDGARVFVVHGPPGKVKAGEGGLKDAVWRPSSRTVLSVIDPASAKIVTKAELGWNWGEAAVGCGGGRGWGCKLRIFGFGALPAQETRRFTMLFPGASSKKPEERLPAELVTVDWTDGTVVGRVPVECVGRLKNRGGLFADWKPLWSLSDVLLSSGSNQLTLLCPGRDAKDAEDRRAAEFVTVEPVPGRVVGQVSLERMDGQLLLSPRDRLAVGLFPASDPKKVPAAPPELRFIDLSVPAVLGSLKLDGHPAHAVFSPDGSLVYVLLTDDRQAGKDSTRARVVAVAVGTRSMEAGTPPAAALGNRPHALRPSSDGRRLFVLAEDAVIGLELPGMKPMASIATGERPESSLVISPDGRRGFLAWAESEEIAILDLEASRLLTTVKVPGVSKFAKVAGAFATWVLLPLILTTQQLVAVSPAEGSGPPPGVQLAFSPDGKWVYARNAQSGKTAILNAETGSLLGVFKGRFRFLSGGLFMGLTESSMTFVDPSSGKEVGKVDLGNIDDFQLSSDERYAVAISRYDRYNTGIWHGAVACIDVAARKVIAMVKDFKGAEQVLLVETPGAGSR